MSLQLFGSGLLAASAWVDPDVVAAAVCRSLDGTKTVAAPHRRRYGRGVARSARAGKTLVVACLVGLMLGACGSSDPASPGSSDEQQIGQVVRSYLTAQTQGDGQTACSLLTSGSPPQLEALVVKRANGLVRASRPAPTPSALCTRSPAQSC